MSDRPMKAPFPWFGGKSRAAEMIWARLGETPCYIEPFAGSLAVLLRRPWAPARYETVNDKDAFVENFWRAVRDAPEKVAEWADYPVNEVALTARHRWLCDVERKAKFMERMLCEPDYYCAKTAGWWVWGLSCWIGAGWCDGVWHGPESEKNKGRGMHQHTTGEHGQRPALTRAPGVHSKARQSSATPEFMVQSNRGPAGVRNVPKQIPLVRRNQGVRQAGVRPDLASSAKGVARGRPHLQRPYELHSPPDGKAPAPQRPALGRGEQGTMIPNRSLVDWFNRLAERLRYVRVCCGDWKRVTGKAVRTAATPCAILLDPPYSTEAGRHAGIYRTDDLSVSHECRAWCVEHGVDKSLRIALCGYEGEGHEELEAIGWTVEAWKASGGYGRIHGDKAGKSLENRHKERIWFSPGCLAQGMEAMPLFQEVSDE